MADNQYELNLGTVRGTDGFSPIIEENPGNTDDDYRLDIVTAEREFTTPNLMGSGGAGTGGGGMTEEQFDELMGKLDAINGMIETKAQEIIEKMGEGGGSSSAPGVVIANEWTVVSSSKVAIGGVAFTFNPTSTINASANILLGITVEKDMDVSCYVTVGMYAYFYLYLNEELIFSKENTLSSPRKEFVLNLKAGVNSVYASARMTSSSYSADAVLELPAIIG